MVQFEKLFVVGGGEENNFMLREGFENFLSGKVTLEDYNLKINNL